MPGSALSSARIRGSGISFRRKSPWHKPTAPIGGWQMRDVPDDEPPYAFLGVRACELAAIAVQDRTFMHDQYVDPIYRRRRERALIIAVNCTQAASTCFCTSMNTGPRCTRALTWR